MKINIYLADWAEATRRNLAGSLADDMHSAECPTRWLASPATWTPTDFENLSHVIETLKPLMGSHNTLSCYSGETLRRKQLPAAGDF